MLYNFAYSFHMPLFLLVSGWLFDLTRLSSTKKVWSWQSIMKDKLLRLGIPMVVFTTIAMVMKTMFAADMARESTISLSYFIFGLINPYEGPLNEMWFVGVLFWCFALQPVWKWSLKNKWRIVMTMAILLLLQLIHPTTHYLSIGSFCSRGIYFYIGLVLSRYKVMEIVNDKKLITLMAGIAMYGVGLVLKNYTHTPATAIVLAFGGIVISCGIALLLDKLCPKVFFSFRDYTYQIFLMGIFFQIFVKMIYSRLSMPYFAGFTACILLGLYGPVVVSKIIQKINFSPLLMCVGLKKK